MYKLLKYTIGNLSRYTTSLFSQIKIKRVKRRFKSCGEQLKIYGNPSIVAPNRIILGNDVVLNDRCILNATSSSIVLGNNIVLSADAKIMAAILDPKGFLLEHNRDHISKGIIIGDNTWICSGAIVCPGVHIKGNVIIAAGAIVTKDIEDVNVIVGGNPAHVVKRI